MKKSVRLIALLLVGSMGLTMSLPTSVLADEASTEVAPLPVTEETAGSYSAYIDAHNGSTSPQETVQVDVRQFVPSQDMQAFWSDDTAGEPCVETGATGSISWNLSVKTEGFYQIQIRYLPLPGKGLEIERSLLIDGALPFAEAESIRFPRVYKDSEEKVFDSSGNQYRSEVDEVFIWQDMVLSGSIQYSIESFRFYFTAGEHTLTLTSKSEPMAISKISLLNPEAPVEYQEVAESYSRNGYKNATCDPIVVEAEKTYLKSDASLYPLNDSKSPQTSPSSASKLLLNCQGGQQWNQVNQWISWEVTVPQDGLYKIMFRSKQSFNQENASSRALYIDDQIPFAEAGEITFPYSTSWQIETVGGQTPYLFYLEAGTHTIRLQNIYGSIGTILTRLDETLLRLNEAYRKIMMYTGAYPDANRDYSIAQNLPEVLEIFREQQPVLQAICEDLLEMTGSKGSYYASVQKLLLQIEGFLEDPETVPAQLDYFRNNISENSTWMISASQQPLLLDYLVVAPPDTPAPKADAPWYQRAWYQVSLLFYSFINDYYDVGGAASGSSSQDHVTLWMGTTGVAQTGTTVATATTSGRDQAQLLRTLVSSNFTAQTGIGVDIRLVDLSALLPAVAAGYGPDIAINQDKTVPVNYALRNALVNLSEFPDVDEVLTRFDPSAVTPYYIGDNLYALPETQTFSMMFWREDILAELGLQPPDTWEDLYALLPKLQQNYMDVGLPNLTDDNPDMFYTFLYQSGGSVYNDDETQTALDSDKAVAAFKEWSELYTKYKITQKMDPLTRFRTGEAPIVIQPFTFYNYLSSTAPEINGLWDFGPIPGTVQPDGTVDRSNVANGTAVILLKGGAGDPEAAWEFMKWWTQADTQVSFGRELENILGTAARWPTANSEALESLWAAEPLAKIKAQKQFVKGLPEVPGGYLTTRYLSSAVRLVVNNAVDPRETLLNWNRKINKEITFMRRQYGLDVSQEEG